jgi:hypothetical protein
LVAEEDAVDEGADGCLFVGVEVGEGFEAQLSHVAGGGARLVAEDKFVGGGVEGEGEPTTTTGPQGGLSRAERRRLEREQQRRPPRPGHD